MVYKDIHFAMVVPSEDAAYGFAAGRSNRESTFDKAMVGCLLPVGEVWTVSE